MPRPLPWASPRRLDFQIIGYARLSHASREEFWSLTRQRGRIAKTCELPGLELIEINEDVDVGVLLDEWMQIISATEFLGTISPMGRPMVEILHVFASMEAKTIILRVSASQEHLCKAGRTPGALSPTVTAQSPRTVRGARSSPTRRRRLSSGELPTRSSLAPLSTQPVPASKPTASPRGERSSGGRRSCSAFSGRMPSSDE